MISSRGGYVTTVNAVRLHPAIPPKRSGGSRWKRGGVPMPSLVVAGGVRAPAATGCSSVNVAAEQLRTQLRQLQAEAEATRSKANSARLRLLRLSEAAEKLRRQAAFDIQNGKENEARELLLQKKKVMQALDRSKTRIELLDGLLAKLNEAISLKERQLIGNLSMLSEVSTVDSVQSIHIISSHDDGGENSKKTKFVESSIQKHGGTEECHGFQADKRGKNLQPIEQEALIDQEAARFSFIEGDDELSFSRKMSSFNDFLEHIDGRLGEIETDIIKLLKLSPLVMESLEKPKSLKVQQALQILNDIHTMRRRIASLIQRKTKEI